VRVTQRRVDCGRRPRAGATALELVAIFGRFAFASVAVSNAARAQANHASVHLHDATTSSAWQPQGLPGDSRRWAPDRQNH
jgi:hypothetical protein